MQRLLSAAALAVFLLLQSLAASAAVEQSFGFLRHDRSLLLRSVVAPVVQLPPGWISDVPTSLRDQVGVAIPAPAGKLPESLTMALVARAGSVGNDAEWLALFGVSADATPPERPLATGWGNLATYRLDSARDHRLIAVTRDGDYRLAFVLIAMTAADLDAARSDFTAVVASYRPGEPELRRNPRLLVAGDTCQPAEEDDPGSRPLPLEKIAAMFTDMEEDGAEAPPRGTGKAIGDRSAAAHCRAVDDGIGRLLGELTRPRQRSSGVVGVSVDAVVYDALTRSLCRLQEEQAACPDSGERP